MIQNFFNKLKKQKKESTADVAKDRLQILIASHRNTAKFDFLPELEKEIMELVRKYVEIDREDIKIQVDKDEATGLEVLEMNVNLPDAED